MERERGDARTLSSGFGEGLHLSQGVGMEIQPVRGNLREAVGTTVEMQNALVRFNWDQLT